MDNTIELFNYYPSYLDMRKKIIQKLQMQSNLKLAASMFGLVQNSLFRQPYPKKYMYAYNQNQEITLYPTKPIEIVEQESDQLSYNQIMVKISLPNKLITCRFQDAKSA